MKRCEHLKVSPDADGKERVRSGKVYACAVDVPLPTLPASITNSHGFEWPPRKSWVAVDDCKKCPLFKPL